MTKQTHRMLFHFSKDLLALDRSIDYEKVKLNPFENKWKPSGLWLSDESNPEDGWQEFCRRNEFNLCGLNTLTLFRVNLEKILVLNTLKKLDAFHESFKIYDETLGSILIDWPSVKKTFSGILISPYRWERRLATEFNWYYGWDCASEGGATPSLIEM